MTSQIRRSGPAPPASRGAEDDATLIRASRLEPERFAGLFRRHAPVLQRYVTRRLGPDAAEDVVAETFMSAFRQRGQYDLSRPDARPWLYGIATNLVGRHRRSEIRQYRALARTGTDPVTEPFTDRVDSTVNGRRTAGQFSTIAAGPGTITFQDLAKLPANPAALAGYLAARARSAPGFAIELQFGPERYLLTGFNNHADRQRTRSGLVFTSICQIFNEYVLPAHLVAELYRVLGALPGVRLDPHATDVAGRSGVAFTLTEGGGRIQLVVDPHDFRVLGINAIGTGWGKGTIGDAFLRRCRLPAPGHCPSPGGNRSLEQPPTRE